MMLKRCGRCHNPAGVGATAPGVIALENPAAPHPGKNLPANWEAEPDSATWKYADFIALDENFRLKCKERGFDSDGNLGPGWGYFVDHTEFAKELDRVKAEKNDNEVGINLVQSYSC